MYACLKIIDLGNINRKIRYIRPRIIAKKITILGNCKKKKERDLKDLFPEIPILPIYIIPAPNEYSISIVQSIPI